jgi:hypothetical protein
LEQSLGLSRLKVKMKHQIRKASQKQSSQAERSHRGCPDERQEKNYFRSDHR